MKPADFTRALQARRAASRVRIDVPELVINDAPFYCWAEPVTCGDFIAHAAAFAGDDDVGPDRVAGFASLVADKCQREDGTAVFASKLAVTDNLTITELMSLAEQIIDTIKGDEDVRVKSSAAEPTP